MPTAALILAAGRGTRLGGDIPKQYLDLAGQPVLRHSIIAFARHKAVDFVRVVIHEDDRRAYERAAAGLGLLAPVQGGSDRQESVRLGLESLAELAPERVLIHDGARPLVDAATISRSLDALAAVPGAIAAVPLADTLKRDAAGLAQGGIERTGLWRAQTPQAFDFAKILAAHRAAAGAGLTDDAAVAERAGLAVRLVPGSEDNIKVTTRDDLLRAERLLAGMFGDMRVGSGFDVHAFGPVRPLMLCGIEVPHERGLEGHSDADVGLHALTDALLGALGAGDIGQHFPPSDPKWRGAASDRFLRHAAHLVGAAGGLIAHLDVTLICERPKIGPHRERMRVRIGEILDLALDRISVKATTTEGLGFTGRGEGIAAQATATVRLRG
ncbi:MAG TPA: bifunctional 2-C-methyl-D-erythritol 4-phosphate cytidylyltransferase/2-C-methyl-D-erythritol 2,4-cyclodiphosphate synthase [Candidatus Sulfotelmatobacter sp.]|nr:bifunctional 2-C-methyl-D-erythritol 4-phosphate cytidylyltransferase/2-C-methyl-D-erythritol 2,4-cyclodiphosphate synthase [Candidatus Sulfotelmatobacter sp.]